MAAILTAEPGTRIDADDSRPPPRDVEEDSLAPARAVEDDSLPTGASDMDKESVARWGLRLELIVGGTGGGWALTSMESAHGLTSVGFIQMANWINWLKANTPDQDSRPEDRR